MKRFPATWLIMKENILMAITEFKLGFNYCSKVFVHERGFVIHRE